MLGSSYYNQPKELTQYQEKANMVFTVLFTLEMFAKIGGLTLSKYLQSPFNIFDMIVITAGIIEVVSGIDNGSLSILRSFRCLRVFMVIKISPRL